MTQSKHFYLREISKELQWRPQYAKKCTMELYALGMTPDEAHRFIVYALNCRIYDGWARLV